MELKPPVCKQCGAKLYPRSWGGLRMAFCPTCSPEINMNNMKGYAGEFDWSATAAPGSQGRGDR